MAHPSQFCNMYIVHNLSCVVVFMYNLYIYLAHLCKYVNIYKATYVL